MVSFSRFLSPFSNKRKANFRYVLLSADAKLPVKATVHSAGYDVFSPFLCTIPAGSTVKIPLDVAICPPRGTYIRIASRSGLAVREQLFCPADVVDPDYTGCIHMCLTNMSSSDYTVQKHERIGSIVFERYLSPHAEEVQVLQQTARGNQGFGSTGKM
jgi:dUTP pyrophosphatase